MTALTEREVAPADRSSRENDSEVGVWPALVAGPRDGARVSRSVNALDACHAARRAWERQDQQTALDFDALNARPGPETARGPHAPISPPGSSVEGASDGLGNGGTPASSLTNKQGEAHDER